ncbi:Serine/threonine-protein phosphatase 2A 65 kDa regulatory subunit A alpha isoform [Astathelohania contejeani]|uniref:Serine/threonine-protein phosphatase 2A 65 kDa regulatory subunit A alpha isoform n=1 Tax=Astathelohania contejeani TaxID=164912 RepID=A0ABQ7I1K1_9MICR|nr:Serine/threonine-protein phosphatase 2A 65 kDa regulatory subunit A alpha isoform [Thelohania contejeani]
MNSLAGLTIPSPTDIPRIIATLQNHIGADESNLPQVLSILKQIYLISNDISLVLPCFELLLLEDSPFSDECINFLKPHLDFTSHPFFTLLLDSPYYRHRLALTQFEINDPIILHKLLNDKVSIVAQHTAMALGRLKTTPFSPSELCAFAKHFCANPYLHSHAIDLLSLIQYPTEEAVSMLAEIASAPSWRVRLRLVRRMYMLTQYSLDEIFILLSEDEEEQIKVELVKNLQYLRNNDIIQKMVARFEQDQSTAMRVAWIEQVSILMAENGLDGTAHLRSCCNDSRLPVRMAALNALKKVKNTLSKEVFNHLFKGLINSFENANNWRIRYALLETIGDLATQEKESEYMIQSFFRYFYDSAAEVREMACKVFGNLSRRFGKEWAVQNLHEIYKVLESRKYVHRVSVTGVVEVYCQLISEEDGLNMIVDDLVRRIANDPIANVRSALIDVLKGYSKRFIGYISDMSVSEDPILREEALIVLNKLK